MPEPIHIHEQSSSFWKMSAFILITLAFILFIIYWNDTNALGAGIIRFISFILFTGGILSGLKIMGGQRIINLYEEEGVIIAAYKKKDKLILKESHNPKDIKQIYYSKQTGINRLAGGGHFYIKYKKSIPDACLFKFAGRCMVFDEESMETLSPFLAHFQLNLVER